MNERASTLKRGTSILLLLSVRISLSHVNRCLGNGVVLASRDEKDDRQESDTEYLVAHLHCARKQELHILHLVR
jgi:hypothetical protein